VRVTDNGSPALSDTQTFQVAVLGSLPKVWINEWMASNTRTVSDPADGVFEDWIEVFNAQANAVDLSGYRIVQESLTNTIKHAGTGAEANVEIRYDEHELQIQVSDNGLGPRPQTHTGKGISGMTERVRLLGGSLTAGPHPAGGYVVQAWLPKDGPIT